LLFKLQKIQATIAKGSDGVNNSFFVMAVFLLNVNTEIEFEHRTNFKNRISNDLLIAVAKSLQIIMKKAVCCICIHFLALRKGQQRRMTHFNLEKMWLFKVMILWLISNKKGQKKNKLQRMKTWFIIFQGNKEYFLKNPSNFEPQYGGWCALQWALMKKCL
jgi:hypothetical protein